MSGPVELKIRTGRSSLGVYATRDLRAGERLCLDPVVELTAGDLARLLATPLRDYWWEWGDVACVVFGLTSMINHSFDANASNVCLTAIRSMEIVATRDIAAGEEITLDYGRLRP